MRPLFSNLQTNGTIYLAGQIAADKDGNLITGSITKKAEQIFRNTESILRATGSDLSRVVKVTYQVFFKDMQLSPEFYAVYDRMLPHKPPRSTVVVYGLPLGVEVKMEAIAVE
ncbi:hypothetical protein BBP40_005726 [Aspergillus hancockii]|nr:hypothetical protein BBP40_005726 [Aspergillus hancockii]